MYIDSWLLFYIALDIDKTLVRAIKKRIKELIPTKIKSDDNFTRNDKEETNVAIAIFKKEEIKSTIIFLSLL